MMSKTYKFVIDTDQYSCYFYQNLSAYLIGKVSAYDVGLKESRIFYEEVGTGRFDYVMYEESEDQEEFFACECLLGENAVEGSPETSVAIFMEVVPPEEDVELLKTRAKKFCEYWKQTSHNNTKITVEGFRLLSEETVTKTETEEVWDA